MRMCFGTFFFKCKKQGMRPAFLVQLFKIYKLIHKVLMYRSNQHFSIICKNNYSVANQPTKRSVLLAKPVIRFFNASGGNIIINNEIPKTIPVADYAGYIMKNFKPDVIKFKKPESEWTEEEHTEYTKWSLKLSMAHRFKQQIQENKPLTNRDKRIIERFRSGADFFGEKICGKETSRLFEQPYTFDLFNEWQEKHFKEHPEDKDKTIEELFDIRLSEQKLYHYKEVNGKYYGAEIPKEIHYTEYFRYLYFNVKYEFSEKTYYRSIPYTDKDKQESIWDRERCFVAQEISEWRVDELEDWQRDLIEKIRVGVELKDDDIVKAMGY